MKQRWIHALLERHVIFSKNAFEQFEF